MSGCGSREDNGGVRGRRGGNAGESDKQISRVGRAAGRCKGEDGDLDCPRSAAGGSGCENTDMRGGDVEVLMEITIKGMMVKLVEEKPMVAVEARIEM